MVYAKFDLVLRPISHGNPAMPFGKRNEKLGNLSKIQRFKFERASFRSSGGRGVDCLLVIGSGDAIVKGRSSYRESRYGESRVYNKRLYITSVNIVWVKISQKYLQLSVIIDQFSNLFQKFY